MMSTEEFKKKIKEKTARSVALLREWFGRFWEAFKRFWHRWHLTKVSISLLLTLSLAASIYLAVLAKTSNVETLQRGLAQTTDIIDEDGEVAGHLQGQKGTYLPLEEISPAISDAVLSTEDKRFYTHRGFDLQGIGRAAVNLVRHRRITGGGSTITQQLAKNAYLTADQTLIRKLRELFLAIEIEKEYSKDTILEMYLNHAYFGHGVWGVQDASLRYFGKDASNVTVGEAAVLAAILKGPSYYNPLDHYDHALERRNLVLDLMVENDKTSPEEAASYQATEIALNDQYVADESYAYPYYFDAVIDEAVNEYKMDEQDLMNGGYTIFTGLNQNYQAQMEQVFAQSGYFETAPDGTQAEGASVAVKPSTGGVQAVVGGNGEYTYRGFNRGTQMYRQPASVNKPLGVYAPAIEAGYTATSVVKDELLSYGETNYQPENYDYQYAGELPLYEAVALSKNASAVWLLDEIGIDRGYNKLKSFGLKPTENDYQLGAVALGGMERGATVLQIASAYSTFANGGVRNDPHFITKIVDANGRVIVNNEKPRGKRVLSEKNNEEMNRILLNVFDHPNNASIEPEHYEIAGKTGTTQFGEDNSGVTDQWVVGYTPDVVVATWTGFDETDENHHLTGSTIQGVGQILRSELTAMLPYSSESSFDVTMVEEEVKRPQWQTDMEEGLEKAGEVLKEVGKKAVDEARKALGRFFD